MAEVADIFSFTDYRSYLDSTLSQSERGARGKLAKFLNCQPSFISQVMNGKNELSLEHAFRINEFLDHSELAKDYFMAMVQLSKAGATDLEDYFKVQMEKIRKEYYQVHSVVEKKELRHEDILSYYGNWSCVATHLLASIEKYRDPQALREKLQLEEKEFSDALTFLQQVGLIEVVDGKLVQGEWHTHLSKSSPYAQAVSVFNRLKLLEVLDISDTESINYSSHLTISKEGMMTLKKNILQFINDLDRTIDDSGDPETFCTIVLDLVEH